MASFERYCRALWRTPPAYSKPTMLPRRQLYPVDCSFRLDGGYPNDIIPCKLSGGCIFLHTSGSSIPPRGGT
jgi:hypothetical protein